MEANEKKVVEPVGHFRLLVVFLTPVDFK